MQQRTFFRIPIYKTSPQGSDSSFVDVMVLLFDVDVETPYINFHPYPSSILSGTAVAMPDESCVKKKKQ